ncbi:DUF6296 family protein [Kitasatospora sp. NPDC093679]|uniref:DUF6296 family protein n=1 Tax=Kitasatospora sp. NPDC093679 TaxID=3154983 RepID=UPI00342720E2
MAADQEAMPVAPAPSRWLLPFPGRPAAHGEQDAVLVEQQAGYGPHGHPIYTDAERTVRVEIEDNGLVHILTLIGRTEPDNPRARPSRPPPASGRPARTSPPGLLGRRCPARCSGRWAAARGTFRGGPRSYRRARARWCGQP